MALKHPVVVLLPKALTSLIVPLAILLIVATATYQTTSKFFFEVTLKTSVPGTVQLFYDPSGRDLYREEDSARFQVNQVDVPVTHRFLLPEGRYNEFRFDPIDRPGQVTFSGARIVRTRPWGVPDEVVRNIPASQFQPALQIRSLKTNGDEAQLITTDNANDPIVLLPLKTTLLLKRDKRSLLEIGGALVELTLILSSVFWLMKKLRLRSQTSVAQGSRRIVRWAERHPFRAISLMAILAAVLSCYPVVFFGKSFVSPDHGTTLLYDKFPTLPGYTTTTIEDAKGADVGAPMWAHFPYSVIEHNAILRDAELPLWNRFNSAGVTLLGQGQSMVGDPLNMGVILAGATSWAWDIKYVAAKTLFALGLGLTIFACTRHLPVSLVLTVSSVYIGFFTYRFSHPAFFSLSYAPWILYFWIRFIQTPSQRASSQVRWLAGLILANWTVMNSGTAKEAYMLLVFLNLTGALTFLLSKEDVRDKWQKGARLLVAEVLFVMISAPVWVTFLEAMQKSFTVSDNPAAQQISPALLIGLFDDIFYRQLVAREGVYLPSANFLILAGLLWAVVGFKRLSTDPVFRGIGLGAIIPLLLVFGVVPATVIVKIPFLANVVHIHNTFSVVVIVHLVVLAGFGMKACWDRFPMKLWPLDMALTIAMLCIPLVLFFDSPQAAHNSAFFVEYGASLAIAFVAVPILARRLTLRPASPAVLVLLIAGFAALHWRHGMYLKTNFDDYVMNPQVRVNLQPESRAIRFVKHDAHEPFRTVGFESNLYPGYNAALGVESIYGPDALMNPFYSELTRLLPIGQVMGWRLVVERRNLKELEPIYDLLNVRDYLSLPGVVPAELPGLTLDGRFDLDVYHSETAWPRAFFTNQLSTYKSATEFAAMALHGEGRPFAAIQDTVLARHPSLQALIGPRAPHVVPAAHYRLTNNTTTFTVSAPERGVVTLTEAYSEGDFSVTLNGKPATVLRLNHAFKGVEIDAPGTYTVRFAYWPRHLTSSLLLSGAGLLLLSVWLYSRGIDRQAHATRRYASGVRAQKASW